MDLLRVTLPQRLTMRDVMPFTRKLDALPAADIYEVDCSLVQHAPPFGMLILAAAIRQWRARCVTSKFFASGTAENSYVSHMGFWRACGIPTGNAPGQARGSDRYLPISTLAASKIRQEASSKSIGTSRVVADLCDELAEIIVQDDKLELIEQAIAYALREMIRNIVDHSHAETIWYSAQYWPTKDLVELAVLDEGRGFLSSLRENPDIEVSSEVQAVIQSTLRGVSRVNPQKQVPRGMWAGYGGDRSENAGLGLFVLRTVAESAGSLVVVSNDTCVLFEQEQSISAFDSALVGSAVRLLLKPSQLGDLLHQTLRELGDTDLPSRMTPSMMLRIVRGEPLSLDS